MLSKTDVANFSLDFKDTSKLNAQKTPRLNRFFHQVKSFGVSFLYSTPSPKCDMIFSSK